jgi:hypothetical protein
MDKQQREAALQYRRKAPMITQRDLALAVAGVKTH